MASAVTYLNITEHQVRQFLDTLLEKHGKGAAHPAHVSGTAAAAAAEAPVAAAAAAAVPLRLHPRVDAVHPLGEAHSSRELEAAINMYKQIVKGKVLFRRLSSIAVSAAIHTTPILK